MSFDVSYDLRNIQDGVDCKQSRTLAASEDFLVSPQSK